MKPPLPALVLLICVVVLASCATPPPTIESVPIVAPDRILTLRGQGFGERQDQGQVMLDADGQRSALEDVTAWADGEIMAGLPDTVQPGVPASVQVVQRGRESNAAPVVVQTDGLPSQPYGYAVPVQDDSPWPTFRRDHRNTGRTTVVPTYRGDQPWAFPTGKGIFSTPVIDAAGTVYLGSADRNFYAINPDGSEKWRFPTGEIIDSAAALGRFDPAAGYAAITVPSGDGHLYHLRTDDGVADPQDRLLWSFDARSAPGTGFNNWFEGNVAIGPDGTLYAGSTNFNYYALDPDGTLRWTYPTGSNNWSQTAFGDDGSLFWGSNDTYVRGVAADGREQWIKRTLGFIAASAAVGSDGTVYIGSFDSKLYALDPQTGEARWTFPTHDHVYSSAALGEDAEGNTDAIYFGSADGVFYALDPDGALRWQFDTGDVIRSSPVLGPAPAGESGGIVYFGAGNGKLYALNTADGSRRWSFDTTPDDPELADRNDLNGSPALGLTGVYIGGEHGNLWYVPYDYCVHAPDDTRCDTQPREDLPADTAGLFYVTPGGSTELEDPASLPAATLISQKLVVRQDGVTLDAGVCNRPIGCPGDSLLVTAAPPFPHRVVPSANGQIVHIIPDGFLQPGTTYSVTVEGDYYAGGPYIGNLGLGGKKQGRFSDSFSFQAQTPELDRIPLQVGPQQVTALEWTRLAVPLPPMLPSLNQIGFDSMDWILGTVAVGETDASGGGPLVLWAVGGQRREDGTLAVDPDTNYLLPLSGRYLGDFFILENRDFEMKITEIPIPFDVFQLRGALGEDLIVKPGASAYAETEVLSIPNFGPYMVVAGLANNWYQKLLAVGTYITRPYAAGSSAPANAAPPGLSVSQLSYTPPTGSADGRVEATLRLAPGASYPAAQHKPAILLVDAATTQAVFLDYLANTSSTADAAGNVATITLALPAGTQLPPQLEAVVMADVFPLHREMLSR